MAEPTLIPVPDVADALGTDVLKVRQMLRDGGLLGVRGEDGILRIPAEFIRDGAVLKGLAGTLTLLRDNGFDDQAALRWLYADDDTLPGSPVQALAGNRLREVRRRAQATAW